VPPPPAITDGLISNVPPDCNGAGLVTLVVDVVVALDAMFARPGSPVVPITVFPNEGSNATKTAVANNRIPLLKTRNFGERRIAFMIPPGVCAINFGD